MVLNKFDLPPATDIQKIKDIIHVYKPVCVSSKETDSTKLLAQTIANTLQKQ